jgi:hypothetical protein
MATEILSVESTSEDRDLFFDSNYPLLRDGLPPMKWMRRLFRQLTDGWHPTLVDFRRERGKPMLLSSGFSRCHGTG